MKKWTLIPLALVLAAGMLTPMSHGDKPKPKPSAVDKLMMSKLINAQKVLEGVTLGDFAKISNHADKLLAISKQLEWKVLHTPEYELYSNEFRSNTRDLIKRAKEKNIDGAALAYIDMTLTCVRCHKHVREVRSVHRDLPAPTRIVRAEKTE
jgi:hypothetical protein